ncbi:hypothetical protein VB712_19615, partial [Spirulina sp. CCNP1310]|uniref:hypothetical protein n=1 Tax=Spirulina sp. CCNP1310 TaxID=3110249 RepID=UPI002B209C10
MRTSKPASAASLAAAIRSGRETVPNSGPMKIPARLVVSDEGLGVSDEVLGVSDEGLGVSDAALGASA